MKEIKDKITALFDSESSTQFLQLMSQIETHIETLKEEAEDNVEREAAQFWRGHKEAGDEALSMLGGRL